LLIRKEKCGVKKSDIAWCCYVYVGTSKSWKWNFTYLLCKHEIWIYKMVKKKKRAQYGCKRKERGEWCVLLMEDDYRMALSVVWSHGFLWTLNLVLCLTYLLSFFSSLYGSFSYSFSFSCPNTRPHYYQIKLHKLTILYSIHPLLFYFFLPHFIFYSKRTTLSLCFTKCVDIDEGDDRPCLFATTIFCSFLDVIWLLDCIIIHFQAPPTICFHFFFHVLENLIWCNSG